MIIKYHVVSTRFVLVITVWSYQCNGHQTISIDICRPKLLRPDGFASLCLHHLLCLRVDLQLRLAHPTLQDRRQLFLQPPISLCRSHHFLVDDTLCLLSEFPIILLSSPHLRLLPHSTYDGRDKMTRPQDPQLICDILEDLGGVFNHLLDCLILRCFGEPVVNSLQDVSVHEGPLFQRLTSNFKKSQAQAS